MSVEVKKGDIYIDGELLITVTRVAKDGSWADIDVYQPSTNNSWTKRQPTPIPGKRVS